jgi:hypothetical protein
MVRSRKNASGMHDEDEACSGTCRMNKQMMIDSYCVQSMHAIRNVNLSEERRVRNKNTRSGMVGW